MAVRNLTVDNAANREALAFIQNKPDDFVLEKVHRLTRIHIFASYVCRT